ncbi:MAG: redoxin domain-containing protein [Rhodospirillales bacterium]|jgi:sugar lactone lactonase YvrE/thiol-disulfide isomerase/thioredoxin|nr:redoxin domain-containing protein [Rhodospirillales bacterium]
MFGLRPAPELSRPGLQWFNVDRPLSLTDLRGRLVVLEFWTGCCVNCLNVQRTLRRIAATFPDDAVLVVGVHSPKFPHEREPDALAHTIDRQDIRYPVIHDPDLLLWREYGVRGWPTLVFVGPDGKVLGDLPGEPDADKLLSGIGQMVHGWRAGAERPPPLPIAAGPVRGGGANGRRLRYPTKIKPAGGAAQRQWVCADSGHHQVVVLDDEGNELRRFGSGEPGFIDLGQDDSAFSSPQGLAANGRSLFVADTGNHAIRRIDLATGMVSTLAGTGERGGVLCRPRPGPDAALASVWDLALRGRLLFFANAGTHQLGVLDLEAGVVRPCAGTGQEDLIDGEPGSACLAQPSSLAFAAADAALYFLDSEASALRRLDLSAGGKVTTLVGAGLFEFGHVNGTLRAARFQHCLGLDWWDGRLIVADSYNGVLRIVDPDRGEVSDLGERSYACADGDFACLEPAGVAVAGPDRLLVADTNNHRLVELSIADRTARTWGY